MIRKTVEKVRKILDRGDKPPLFILSIYKRHILFLIAVIWIALAGYGAYFRYFMVLPQSSVDLMPKFELSLTEQKILVLAPHCDDETLGVGGLMQRAKEQNSEIKVVIVTDCNKSKIGATRKNESIEALKELGIDRQSLIFWDFPEKESSKKKNPQNMSLKQAIDQEIESFKPTLIIALHSDDTHIDHKNTGIFTSELVHDKYQKIKIAYYLIHYNFLRYPTPTGLHFDYYLTPPARLVSFSNKWYILDLSQEEEDNKQNAILKYRSQLSLKNPILHEMLLDFVRQNELFMIQN